VSLLVSPFGAEMHVFWVCQVGLPEFAEGLPMAEEKFSPLLSTCLLLGLPRSTFDRYRWTNRREGRGKEGVKERVREKPNEEREKERSKGVMETRT
jgi:hypothetical protein